MIELILAYGSPVALQIYRYRRVSTPAQRQQTKWVIFGLTCAILLFLLAAFSTIGALGPFFYLASASLSSFAFLSRKWACEMTVM